MNMNTLAVVVLVLLAQMGGVISYYAQIESPLVEGWLAVGIGGLLPFLGAGLGYVVGTTK